MNFVKVSAILLDVDGTLINSMPTFQEIITEEVVKRGKEVTEEELSRIGKELYSTFASQNISGGRRMAFKLFYYLGRVVGFGRFTSIRFMFGCINRIRHVYKDAPLFDDVIPSLEKLKATKLPLGLVTMASKNDIAKTTQLQQILGEFDILITRDDVKKIKPDPEACFLAADMLKVPAEECYFVGDLPFDIHAGRAAKMVTVAVTTGLATSEYLEYSNPDVIFDNLTKATDWILQRIQEFN